ncbi:5'/3'-nucleotidase SurE [Phormidium sp. CCY1219]|uniref:5'/3'-nucleotidase SurE n=1 Tax=Phormidium sp. CCY1219 TaxID=2886104 RepID=UPI002D1E9306|nr:5'/3'-nucleotidase SurE [Phormidium sp. CCY1219]MEB3828500.1 5'/3'-nucleotidase SurE [Phormidium sp. CCY1219]
MKLLLSNDDGIYAPGILSLASALAKAGHQVFVVCPDRERSATGHGLTMHSPIRAEVVESMFPEGIRAWACSGTPADCVKLALWALLDTPPDLVIAGINQGQNLGTDILYSGTVSAAMEGFIEGIPSLAFSLASYEIKDFQPAANFAVKMVELLKAHPLPKPMLFNVNVPGVPTEEIVGVALTRQGVRRYVDIFQKRTDPRGKTYYWLAGEVLEEVEQTLDPQLNANIPTDVEAIRKNYITLTPLHYNFTSLEGLEILQEWEFPSQ